MAGEAILILETDPAAEATLNDVLSAAGYSVYAADSPKAVIKALEATHFPMVMIDTAAPYVDPEIIAHDAVNLQPDCMVIFTGKSCVASDAIGMMRGGAVDYISKPIDGEELLVRVAAALERRRRQRARLKLWERRAKAAEMSLGEAQTGSGAEANRLQQASDFADYALEKFLNLERQNIELERAVRQYEDPGASEARAPTKTWIAHSDNEFAAGVASLGPKLRLDVGPPMSTGGEVLDKLSSSPPGIVVLDGALPDIPCSLVVQTIHSEYPDIQTIVVDGWGTDSRTVVLSGGGSPEMRRIMSTVQELMELLEIAADRAGDTAMGRDFAAEFKARHEDFLRRFADMKRLVGD